MSGAFDASHPRGRTVLALVLCFLAMTFAMEAKLAWFGPEHGLGSDVRAAKALPADTHQVLPSALADTYPTSPLISLALLAAIAAAFLQADRVLDERTAGRPVPDSAPSYFSPHQFFRPPPVR